MVEEIAEDPFEYEGAGYMFEPEYNDEELNEREEQERVAAQQQADAEPPMQRTLGDASIWCQCGHCGNMPSEEESMCCFEWEEWLQRGGGPDVRFHFILYIL